MTKLVKEPTERSFGEGWMSKNAADLVKIAVTSGGFNIAEIMKELPINNRGSLNCRSIENALQRLRDQRRGEK